MRWEITFAVYSIATKKCSIEILNFKHFHQHVVLIGERENLRNKVLKNHITVSMIIELGVGRQSNKKAFKQSERLFVCPATAHSKE